MNWKCTECGEVYKSNPKNCTCGNTVFQPTEDSPEPISTRIKNWILKWL